MILPKSSLKLISSFLNTNIFVMFGGRVFQQTLLLLLQTGRAIVASSRKITPSLSIAKRRYDMLELLLRQEDSVIRRNTHNSIRNHTLSRY